MSRFTKFLSNHLQSFSNLAQQGKDVVFDLGSENINLFIDNKLVLTKPSRILVHQPTMSIIGESKGDFQSASRDKLTEVVLIREGAITEFELMVKYLQLILSQIKDKYQLGVRSNFFCLVPSDYTQVETKILQKILQKVGLMRWSIVAKKNFVIANQGVVIDIGNELTEVIIGGTKADRIATTIKSGSRQFTKVIQDVVREKYNLDLSWREAERIKYQIQESDFFVSNKVPKQKISVRGKDIQNFTPTTQVIEYKELHKELLEVMEELLEELKLFFAKVPINTLMQSMENGIFLWGGGSKLVGLKEYLSDKLQTQVELNKPVYEKCI